MHLERKVSGWPAVRREMERFERMQIWISDRKIGELADRQYERMKKTFGTTSIPLHVVMSPDGRILGRLTYSPNLTEQEYLDFLAKAR